MSKTTVCKYCGHILIVSSIDCQNDSGYDSPSRWIDRYDTEACPNCGYFKRHYMPYRLEGSFTRKYWDSLPIASSYNNKKPHEIGDGFPTKLKPLRRW